jgi:hypothetical protein
LIVHLSLKNCFPRTCFFSSALPPFDLIASQDEHSNSFTPGKHQNSPTHLLRRWDFLEFIQGLLQDCWILHLISWWEPVTFWPPRRNNSDRACLLVLGILD